MYQFYLDWDTNICYSDRYILWKPRELNIGCAGILTSRLKWNMLELHTAEPLSQLDEMITASILHSFIDNGNPAASFHEVGTHTTVYRQCHFYPVARSTDVYSFASLVIWSSFILILIYISYLLRAVFIPKDSKRQRKNGNEEEGKENIKTYGKEGARTKAKIPCSRILYPILRSRLRTCHNSHPIFYEIQMGWAQSLSKEMLTATQDG